MTKLPEKNVLDGSKNPRTSTLEMKTALGELRDYLNDLLGADSTDKQAARNALGINLDELNGKITGLADNIANKANSVHTHAMDDVNGLSSALDNLSITSEKVTGVLGYTPYDAETNPKQFTTKAYVDEAVQNADSGGAGNADWNATTGKSEILNKPDLSVYSKKEDFDSLPTHESDNPVKSGGVYTALQSTATNTLANVESCPDFRGYEISMESTGATIDLTINSPNHLHLKTSGSVSISAEALANEVSKQITISAVAQSTTTIQWPDNIHWIDASKAAPEWGQETHTLVVVIWFVGGNVLGSSLFNSEVN